MLFFSVVARTRRACLLTFVALLPPWSPELETLGGDGLSGCPLAHARLRHQLNYHNDDMFYSPSTLRPLRRHANRRHTDSADLLASRVQEFNCTWAPGSPSDAMVQGMYSSPGRAKSSPALAECYAGTPDSTCDSYCDETMSVMMMRPAPHKTPGAAGPTGRARSRLSMFVEEEEQPTHDMFGGVDSSWLKRAGSGGVPSPAFRRFRSVDGLPADGSPAGYPSFPRSRMVQFQGLTTADSMPESEDTLTQVTCMESEGYTAPFEPLVSEPSFSGMIPLDENVPPLRTYSSNVSEFDTVGFQQSTEVHPSELLKVKTVTPKTLMNLMMEENCKTPTGTKKAPVEFSTPVLRRVDSPGGAKGKSSSFMSTYLPQANSKVRGRLCVSAWCVNPLPWC